MNRIMVDSTTTVDEPKTAEIACAYINGSFGVQTPTSMEKLFPHSKYGWCFIDVNGKRPDADARDWETGDKSGSLEQWVKDHNAHSGKKDAVIYCNRATIAEVRRLTGTQILNEDYFLWIATLDNSTVTGTGIIACQNKGEKQTGGHFDSSIVYDARFWIPLYSPTPLPTPTPKPVPAPVPAPKPAPPKRPNCVPLQRAVRVAADNLWGANTDKHCDSVSSASVFVGQKFPYGIPFAQKCVGAVADDVWGPHSKANLISTTRQLQTALKTMGFNPGTIDGEWGPNTQKAYNAARAACHI